jgi:hypothetical protein
MTTRELRRNVSALCFTDVGEKDERFLAYANLALGAIYNEITFTNRKKLYPVPIIPTSFTDRILHKCGETVTIPLSGKAFSLYAVGKGCITLLNGDIPKRTEFDTEGTAIRGFLSKEASLILSGDYAFSVYSLAVFSDILSEDERDIPTFDRIISFDLRETVTDFGGFLSLPTDEFGRRIENAVFSDGRLTLSDFHGAYAEIEYRRIPKRIYADDPDSCIDLPEEYSPLLVWLCAHYLCLEDERDIAEDHLAHYRVLLASLKSNLRSGRGVDYIDTNGWA